MSEYTPEKVAELVAHLRKKRAFFEKFSSDTENETMILLRSSADTLTAISADRDRLHKAITEALDSLEENEDPDVVTIGVLRAAINKEGQADD